MTVSWPGYTGVHEHYRYETGRTLVNKIFGGKCHKDFPKTKRTSNDECSGEGFYPSKLESGDPEYTHDGLDLLIEAGETVSYDE